MIFPSLGFHSHVHTQDNTLLHIHIQKKIDLSLDLSRQWLNTHETRHHHIICALTRRHRLRRTNIFCIMFQLFCICQVFVDSFIWQMCR